MKRYLFRIVCINETVCWPVGMKISGRYTRFLIDVVNAVTLAAAGDFSSAAETGLISIKRKKHFPIGQVRKIALL